MKSFNWNTWGKYYEQNVMPFKTYMNGMQLMRKGETYYLKNKNEIARLPKFVSDTLLNKISVTYIIGPWVFINGFENTPEGRYLIKIFPYYFRMSPRTTEKVNAILNKYEFWARTHKAYVEAMTNDN